MRPTFYLNGDNESPIRAGGVLFYKYIEKEDKYELLMIYSRNNYEDFGGCTDAVDKSIEETVARETEEESNCIFGKQFVLDKIKDLEPVYIKKSKYVVYFVQLDGQYDPEIFGDKEYHDGFDRKVEWIPYDKFKDKEFLKIVNGRLNNWPTIKYMQELFI